MRPDRLPPLLRLEQLDCIAQLGGPLVKFLGNSRFHFALHDLQLRERAFGPYFLKPFIEKRDLRAFGYQLRKVRLLQKIHNRFATALNFRNGVGKFSLSQKDGSLGTRIHHEYVRPKLLQTPGEIIAIRVVVDESKKIEI